MAGIQLHWGPNASTSALHVAEMCWRFPERVTDPQILGSFSGYASSLGEWIASLGVSDPDRVWDTLVALGSMIDSNHELANSVLRKSVGHATSETHASVLAGNITDIEASFKQVFPKYLEQSPLRMRPLQDQWLGYGNGLIAHLGRLTEKELIVDECRIVGVQPVIGGYGKAHIEQNLVRVEVLLTNPLAELPEVVRLAWLISQLQLDLPRFNDLLGIGVARRLAPLAMLPPVLAAAEVLEIGRCDEETASLAIEQWQIAIPEEPADDSNLAASLMDWWETYLQTRPTWELALRALAKMLNVTLLP